MLGASALCNSNTNQKLAHIFERLDLSGIFIMIAASYTPFMLAKLDERLRDKDMGIELTPAAKDQSAVNCTPLTCWYTGNWTKP